MRGQRPPGGGGADGDALGALRGPGPGPGPALDAAVPRDGYAWWYVDVVDPERALGLTLIFFVGSVFSPAYARARARGAGDPDAFCAVNVCLYGPRTGWAFTERPLDPATRGPADWTLGRSRIAWQDGVLLVQFDEPCTPFPGRLRGSLRLTPELLGPAPLSLDAAGRHRWWPVAPRAHAEVVLEQPALRFTGQGYHDANWGDEPLERAFRRWTWTRAWTEEGVRLSYDTVPVQGEPVNRTLRFGEPERDEGEGELHELPGTLWRVGRSVRTPAGGSARLRDTFEDTPFYNRSLLELDLGDQRVAAVHETVDLERFQRAWVQGLLPFRIRREEA